MHKAYLPRPFPPAGKKMEDSSVSSSGLPETSCAIKNSLPASRPRAGAP